MSCLIMTLRLKGVKQLASQDWLGYCMTGVDTIVLDELLGDNFVLFQLFPHHESAGKLDAY